ncbi:MAG: hypothetical protein JSV88_04520 [Candidatus Aminicenantes bacterium]|nr:MAG: hypothetical protein JSV88_04520 [Candidatus Aminicenantes bacterium]
MIAQMGCKIYKSSKIRSDALRERLENYRNEIEVEGLSGRLIENIEDFTLLDQGVQFKFLYDYVVPIQYRQEIQRVLRTADAEIRITDPQDSNLYFVYSSSNIADSIRVRLSKILSGTDNFIEKISIPPNVLRDILEDEVEAIEIKYGWWDNIETYARKGALKGNLRQSRYYRSFEQTGDPTSIIFESNSTGRTIKITSKGIITFYGQDITQQEIEDYIIGTIISGV